MLSNSILKGHRGEVAKPTGSERAGMETLHLTSEDIAGLATPAEYVDAVREGDRQRRPAGLSLGVFCHLVR